MLFGETPSRVVISFAPESLDRVRDMVGEFPFEVLGKVGGTELRVSIAGKSVIASGIAELEDIWLNALGSQLQTFDAAAEV